MHSSGWDPGTDTMHVTRGAQRAIGERRHRRVGSGDRPPLPTSRPLVCCSPALELGSSLG